jgi:hypothetical protein
MLIFYRGICPESLSVEFGYTLYIAQNNLLNKQTEFNDDLQQGKSQTGYV